jgi:hypothetical protein
MPRSSWEEQARKDIIKKKVRTGDNAREEDC